MPIYKFDNCSIYQTTSIFHALGRSLALRHVQNCCKTQEHTTVYSGTNSSTFLKPTWDQSLALHLTGCRVVVVVVALSVVVVGVVVGVVVVVMLVILATIDLCGGLRGHGPM